MSKTEVTIIGYSGHAYVVCEALELSGHKITGYCDKEEKSLNPYSLSYLGDENANSFLDKPRQVFAAIGNNQIREKVIKKISTHHFTFINAIHPSAIISKKATIKKGILVAAITTINPFAKIGKGVILNTGCIIEHECKIGDFAHIAPGAVLAGNVTIGERSFIGANSVVKQGSKIGKDVIVGAGTVVINDLPDGVTAVGNPARIIKYPNQK